jgi:[acyl-carrier-protein] S-malonyltransferase
MKKIGMIFPGEDSFYAGMGKELYINYAVSMDVYGEIELLSGYNLTDRLFDSYCCSDFSSEEKKLAVLAAEIINFTIWKEKYEIVPYYFIAEGFGIVPALVCAGAITINEAVCIIQSTCNAEKIIFKTPEYPILSSISGYKGLGRDEIADIVAAIPDTVNFCPEKCMTGLKETSIDCLLEIGPGNRLYKELKAVREDIICGYFDTMQDRNYILENISYKKFFNRKYFIMRLLGIAAATRNYNADYTGYNKEVVRNYGKLKDLCDGLEKSSLEATQDHVCEAFNLLETILRYKQLPSEEIAERYNMLTEETLICINDYI